MHRRTPVSPSRIDQLVGKQVAAIALDSSHLALNFSDGTTLLVSLQMGTLKADVNHEPARSRRDLNAPTKRQLEYLSFISKYIFRFGRAPAESDIERHFLVSAPSVNQMMQTLERRGFISRQAGVARSTKICVALEQFATRC